MQYEHVIEGSAGRATGQLYGCIQETTFEVEGSFDADDIDWACMPCETCDDYSTESGAQHTDSRRVEVGEPVDNS